MLKQTFYKIPKLPLSALIFYIGAVILWKVGCIPPPGNSILFLENLYNSYGLTGLFIASFLEGIVYLGLYFPGSFIVALAVILSDGTLKSLLEISLIVTLALTLTSLINYSLGRNIIIKKLENKFPEEKTLLSKSLLISMLHPNALAFYFFNLGIKKHNLFKLILVPLIMIPYGLILGYIFYSIKEPLKTAIETPYIMTLILLFWMFIAWKLENRKINKIEYKN